MRKNFKARNSHQEGQKGNLMWFQEATEFTKKSIWEEWCYNVPPRADKGVLVIQWFLTLTRQQCWTIPFPGRWDIQPRFWRWSDWTTDIEDENFSHLCSTSHTFLRCSKVMQTSRQNRWGFNKSLGHIYVIQLMKGTQKLRLFGRLGEVKK